LSYILLTAAAIAACSFCGAVIGFFFQNIPQRLSCAVLGCAAGIMLCAAAMGLAAPAVRLADNAALCSFFGILSGAFFLTGINKAGPRLAGLMGISGEEREGRRAMIFVLAVAIHHFPEGIAAGVSFGTGDLSDAITVVSGIAFQNIPEGMIIIPPLLAGGATKKRAAVIAVISGLCEVLGAFFGYFAISISAAILPFALFFAAGTMLYVIIDDMVPETHSGTFGRLATYSMLIGFCTMLAADSLL